jgi:hypothetical protein
VDYQAAATAITDSGAMAMRLSEIVDQHPSLTLTLTYVPTVGWNVKFQGLELPSGIQELTYENRSMTEALRLLTQRLSGRRFTIIATGAVVPVYTYTGF